MRGGDDKRRCFWAVIIGVFIVGSLWSCGKLVHEFYQHPKATRIQLHPVTISYLLRKKTGNLYNPTAFRLWSKDEGFLHRHFSPIRCICMQEWDRYGGKRKSNN